MQGRRGTGWLRGLPALLLAFAAVGAIAAPGAALAQEPAVKVEVAEVREAEGSKEVTVVAPASLAGTPKVAVDGVARKADASVGRHPAVVLALETSSSMGFGQIGPIRDAAVAFLRQLPPTTKVAVVTFDNVVKTSGFADVAAAQAALENVTPTGGSALFDAVNSAATSLREDKDRASTTVVLVTHGWDWGGASASTRADSFGAVQALGGEVYPVIIGSDFDQALLTGFANPARTAPWTLDDLASGVLASAVASGARVEHHVQFSTSGLKGGDHELTVGWDGPTPVTSVVRAFPVAAPATKAGLAATAEGVASALNLNNGESGGNNLVPVATVVMLGLLTAAFWTLRRSRNAATSKVGGRLEQLEDIEPAASVAPLEAASASSTPPAPSAFAADAMDELATAGPVVGPIVPRSAPKPDVADQRAFERVQLGVGADLALSSAPDAEPLAVLAFDISEGGLSFRSHTEIPAGATGYLTMQLPPNGDEVQLHVLILNVVQLDGGAMYSAHCSFIDITPRTLWRIVGACLALSGDTSNAEELMHWGVRHAVSAELPEGDALFEPATAAAAAPVVPMAADPFATIGEPFSDVADASFVDEFAASVAYEAAVNVSHEGDAGDAFEADTVSAEAFDDVEPTMAGEPFGDDSFVITGDRFEPVPDEVVADEVAHVAERDAEFAAPAVSVGPEGSYWDGAVGHAAIEASATAQPVADAVDAVAEGSEPEMDDWFEVVAATVAAEDAQAHSDDADEQLVAAGDDRAMSAAMQLTWLLGDAADAQVAVSPSAATDSIDAVEVDERVAVASTVDTDDGVSEWSAVDDEASAPSPVAMRSDAMLETRFESAETPDEVQCSHCAGGVLELQRLVRQEDFLESWWLCMACSRITYRQQAPEAWLRTTSVPESGEVPGPAGAGTDFGAVLLRMRQEEAAATARAAELREELARAESVLRDIRQLHRLLDRFGGEGERRPAAAPEARSAGESPAA